MRSRRAFTLVELLVVVSIIALLIAILMPSLKKARVQTQRSVCAANLRQIGVGLQSYLLDNSDRFPYASFMPSVDPFPLSTPEPIAIADVLAPHLDGQEQVFHCPKDESGTSRPEPNAGKSYFDSEGSSYEYRVRLRGRTISEYAARREQASGQPLADNTIWTMRDYDNFHAAGGKQGSRRYLYVDGHVADFENY